LSLTITNGTVDRVGDKLPALQAYQLSLAAPVAPAGIFDAAAAARGTGCHTGSLFTDANSLLHPPGDSVVEPETPSYASRSATKMYRTTPLKGLWQHAPYFHDGSAATLEDVGTAYNNKRALGLTAQEVAGLAHYLNSL
jgi:cytochrome c peroxidase